MHRSWFVYIALVVFVLAGMGQAQAALTFTFGSSAVSFNANGNSVDCGSGANSINMGCSWGGAGDLGLPISTNQPKSGSSLGPLRAETLDLASGS